MKYKAFYADQPGTETAIEAPDHRSAAEHLFSRHPRFEDCQITVETSGFLNYSIQQFHVSDFMDEQTRQALPRQAQSQTGARTSTTESQFVSTLFKRYKDAYTGAHAVVTVGGVIKGIGAFLGICIVIAGIAMGSGSSGGGVAMIIGIIGGCLVGVPTYVLGILVAAQGQTQLATLDTAVNSSRHLSNEDVEELLTTKWSL